MPNFADELKKCNQELISKVDEVCPITEALFHLALEHNDKIMQRLQIGRVHVLNELFDLYELNLN